MRFGTWLLKQRYRRDAIGDLARMFDADEEIDDASAITPADMEMHYACSGVPLAAIRLAENEWRVGVNT